MVTLRSGGNYLLITLTDNDNRVWVKAVNDNYKSASPRDRSWDGKEYSRHYYDTDNGIVTEEIDSDQTVPKEIAMNVAIYFCKYLEIVDVSDPYYWTGNLMGDEPLSWF